MPFNLLLLLPLVGGYLFLSSYKLTRIKAKRWVGHRLVIFSMIPAIVLLFISLFITYYASQLFPRVAAFWRIVIPIDHSGTALISLLLSIVSIPVLNFFTSEERQITVIRKSIQERGDGLEILVDKALHEEKQLMITLRNNLVYIGYITRSFNPEDEDKERFLQILPTLSGYREEQTKEVHITTSYIEVYDEIVSGKDPRLKGMNLDDFQKAISVSEILTVNIFDMYAYQEMNKIAI